MEDPVQMLKRYPLMNEYWEDKRANISRIQVPAYILASYSTFLHLPGSLRGYEEMCHSKKWYVKVSQRNRICRVLNDFQATNSRKSGVARPVSDLDK